MADYSQEIGPLREDEVELASVPPFDIGGLCVRPAIREISKAGAREIVEPRMLKVLVVLWQDIDQVVSRDRLIVRAWSGRIVSDDSINNSIAKLRRIGQAHDAFDIETVSRVGYRLIARPAPLAKAQSPRRTWLPPVIAAAVIGLLAVGVWARLVLWPAPDPVVQVDTFQALPAGPEAEALAGRTHDQITSALTTLQLDFTSTGRGPKPALRVGGTVENSGALSQVRMTVSDGRLGTVLWQGAFEGSSALDSPLAEQAAARTATAITMATEMQAASKGRIPPGALRAYIRARDGYREQRNPIERVADMRTIIKAAPKVGLAHAAFAQTLVDAATEQPPAARAAWIRESISESGLAMRLDPSLGIAYTSRSGALGPKDFAGRQAILEEGLKRAPLDGAVQAFVGLFLAETGRPNEGLPYVRRSQALDPFAAPRKFANATYFTALGHVDEGRNQLLENRRIWPQNRRIPAFNTLFAILAASPAEGRAMIRDLDLTFPDAVARSDLWLAFFDSLECRCRTGQVAAEISRAGLSGEIEPGIGFTALARLGAIDQALALAEHARSDGHLREQRLLFAQQTANLRRDPRFMDLSGRLGLVDYWRSSGRWPEFCADPGLPYDCKQEAARVAGAKNQRAELSPRPSKHPS